MSSTTSPRTSMSLPTVEPGTTTGVTTLESDQSVQSEPQYHTGNPGSAVPPPAVQEIFESPAFDVSVIGYPDDVRPESSGADLMAIVTKHLREDANIECCIAAEAALIYYGAHRVMSDWILCVAEADLDLASVLVKSLESHLDPFGPSAMKATGTLQHHFPRFKFAKYRCFFYLVPGWVYRLPCTPESVELSKKGLPMPKLEIFAQSLIETLNLVDLDDLIDGMDLSVEWGHQHLDLDGTTDQEWAQKRLAFHAQCGEFKPIFLRKGGKDKRQLWEDKASETAKLKRRGIKADPRFLTRFRRVGQGDPRRSLAW